MTYIVIVIHKYLIGSITQTQVLNIIAVSDSQGVFIYSERVSDSTMQQIEHTT